MGKGDGGCDSGTTTRRNVEQEVGALREEVELLKEYLRRTAGSGRDNLQGQVAETVARLEDELGDAQERIEELEEKTEPKGLAKLWQRAVKDKGLFFGGAALALGTVTANPLLMAVGGVAMGLNKLRHMREDEDRAEYYVALRGGNLNVAIAELERFKKLPREEQMEIIKEKEKERQENGGNPVVSFMEPKPQPTRSSPEPRSDEAGAPYEEEVDPEEEAGQEARPSPEQVANIHAQSASEEATDRLDADLRDWLREEQKEAGGDYGEEISNRAVLARELLLASNAAPLPAEDEEKIRQAVAEMEGEMLYSNKELAAEKKAIEAEEKALIREREKFAAPYKKEITKLEEQKNKIMQQRQELEAAGQLTPEVDQQISAAVAGLSAQQKQVENQLIQDAQPFVKKSKELGQKINGYNEKVAVRTSPTLGNIPSLVNLVLDSDNQAACRSCGRVPRTVRRSCSGCGTPFVLSPDTMPLVGRGDEGLREMGQLDLVEEYEGDAERRAEKLSLWRQGKGTVSSEETKKRRKSEASSSGSSSSKKDSATSKKATVPSEKEVSLDQSEDDYVAARNAARQEAEKNDQRYQKAKKAAEAKARKEGREVARLTTSIGVTGKNKFPEKVRKASKTATGKEIHQVDAVLDEGYPADFNIYPGDTNLRRARPGDRVILRNNDSGQALGHAVIDEVVNIDLDPQDHQDEEKLRSKLEPMWDKVAERMPAWYKKEDFMSYMIGQVQENPKRTKASMAVYGQTYRFPEPMKANGQGGFATLQGSAEAQQGLIDAVYRNEYRQAKSSPKKAAKTESEMSKCQAKTASGDPCKKLQSPGSKYCVIHKKQEAKA